MNHAPCLDIDATKQGRKACSNQNTLVDLAVNGRVGDGHGKTLYAHCSILLTSDWSDAQLGVTRQPGSPQLVAHNRSHVHRNENHSGHMVHIRHPKKHLIYEQSAGNCAKSVKSLL